MQSNYQIKSRRLEQAAPAAACNENSSQANPFIEHLSAESQHMTTSTTMEPSIEYPKTHSCDACSSSITFEWDTRGSDNSDLISLAIDKPQAVGVVSYGEVGRYGQNGCALMERLITPRRPTDGAPASSNRLLATASHRRDIREVQISFEWSAAEEVETKLHNHRAINPILRDFGFIGSAIVCALPNDPAASEVAVRPVNMYPGSDDTMKLVRTWLEECVTGHEKCSIPRLPTSRGPKRLLRVDPMEGTLDLMLTVVECSNLPSTPPYVALSYCWGGPQSRALCHDNMAAWAGGIPANAVPKTISDACEVARGLGLEYIWVDSLCIMQSDAQEKLAEIAAMGSIYEHAHITLSAARAASTGEGFLHPRHCQKDLVVPMPYRCKDGRPGSVQLWFNRDKPHGEDPIVRRGWVYQETVLSLRVLTYGTHQVRWNCQVVSPQNARVDGWSDYDRYFHGQLDWRDAETTSNAGNSKQPVCAKQWDAIVGHYTRRFLSDPADRLAAISAVVKKLQETTADSQYVAGLWRHCLPEHLLWVAFNTSEPPSYTAPSWSWASLTGRVSFLRCGMVRNIEVIDVGTETAAPAHDPHGPVIGGFIKLRGMIAMASTALVWDEISQEERQVCFPLQKPGTIHGQRPALNRYNSEWVDWSADLNESQELLRARNCQVVVHLLRFDGQGSSSPWANYSSFGLVLLQLADGGFCRIGRYEGLRYGKPLPPSKSFEMIVRRDPRRHRDVTRFDWERRCVTIF